MTWETCSHEAAVDGHRCVPDEFDESTGGGGGGGPGGLTQAGPLDEDAGMPLLLPLLPVTMKVCMGMMSPIGPEST